MVMLKVASFELSVPSFAVNVKLSAPFSFAFGVYVRFGAVPLRMPFVGALVIVQLAIDPSTSVATSVVATAVSSSVVALPLFATGASLTAFTVIVTVTAAEDRVPSVAVYVKLSVPLKSAFGV